MPPRAPLSLRKRTPLRFRGIPSMPRFGLGFRAQHFEALRDKPGGVDWLELLSDNFLGVGGPRRAQLEALRCAYPIALHGVSLGMASAAPVETKRLDRMARLCDEIRPQFWSEHLAFVRGGGIEIGHLTSPPRTAATIDGAAANLTRARAIVGEAPLVENIATLIDPPGSDRDETTWISAIAATADVPLLLDLHNLYANGLNFGFDPRAALARLREDLVEQADEIDRRELPDRNVDRFQRRNDPVAHRDEVIIGETGRLPNAHRHHDTKIAHEKWSIARER